MKALIVYVSLHHQNTERIAREMAAAIGADCKRPEEVDRDSVASYDLIGLGSGIYYSSHHRDLLNFVNGLDRLLRHKRTFIFSTSGFEELVFHQALKERLAAHGAEIVGEFKCGGWNTYGPFEMGGGLQQGRPDRMDLRNASDFALELVRSLEQGSRGRLRGGLLSEQGDEREDQLGGDPPD